MVLSHGSSSHPGVAALVTGSPATTMVFAVSQSLPSCTDPTGQNLPCLMVISTLPPPANAVQCQESSGQILPCSYATQNLSNGQEIVVITVYAPPNYVFAGYGPWTVVKIIIHETKTRIVHVCPDDQILNHTTHKCVQDKCPPGQVYNPTTGKCEPPIPKCERPDADAKFDFDQNLKTIDCDLGDANEHGKTPQPASCNSANHNATCLPTNNTKTSASGGFGARSTCVNNCTTSTLPPVDCTKNPTDPSCASATQTLTPSPTTKTCPDDSVIDASATCPSTSNNNPNPPSTSNPPTNTPNSNNPPSTDNNPPGDNTSPPSNNGPSDNGKGSSGGSDSSGSSGSSGGSSTPQPSTLS